MDVSCINFGIQFNVKSRIMMTRFYVNTMSILEKD